MVRISNQDENPKDSHPISFREPSKIGHSKTNSAKTVKEKRVTKQSDSINPLQIDNAKPLKKNEISSRNLDGQTQEAIRSVLGTEKEESKEFDSVEKYVRAGVAQLPISFKNKSEPISPEEENTYVELRKLLAKRSVCDQTGVLDPELDKELPEGLIKFMEEAFTHEDLQEALRKSAMNAHIDPNDPNVKALSKEEINKMKTLYLDLEKMNAERFARATSDSAEPTLSKSEAEIYSELRGLLAWREVCELTDLLDPELDKTLPEGLIKFMKNALTVEDVVLAQRISSALSSMHPDAPEARALTPKEFEKMKELYLKLERLNAERLARDAS